MGLPKTGSTATAGVFHELGLNVAHHTSSVVDESCQVMSNSEEANYGPLDAVFPDARWLILFSSDRLAWLRSVHAHVGLWPNGVPDPEHFPPLDYLPAVFFGCSV